MKKFKNIYIEINNDCNLSCSFCPRTNRPLFAMLPDEFKTTLDRVIDFTQFIYLHVVGEPLLNPSLDKILDYCDKKGAKIKITTNGTLLKYNLDMLCRHVCIKAINISLSCIKDFDLMHQSDYLNEVLPAAEFLAQNNIPTTLRVWTNTISLDYIKAKLEHLLKITIDPIKSGTNRIVSHLLLDVSSEFVWPINSTADKTIHNHCLGLRKQLAILSDGSVVPCCLDSEGTLLLGNIFDSSLEEIVSGERAQRIAKGFSNGLAVEDFCKSCTFAKIRL